MSTSLRHRSLLVPAVVVLVPLACAGTAAPAHAAVTDVSCSGTSHATFSPGLTNTARQTTVTNDNSYGPCTSTDAALKSGKSHFQYSRMDSCQGTASGTTGQKDITWNTGKTSTFQFTRTVTEQNGSDSVHLQGRIAAGEFAGETAVEDIKDPDPSPGNCATAQGETSTSGTFQFQITKP